MKESPDPIDSELFALEDDYIKFKLDALGSLADAGAHVRQYINDNKDMEMMTTVRSPQGEVFNVDMLPFLPDMLLEMAKIQFKQLKDMGKGLHARQTLKRLEKKWKK